MITNKNSNMDTLKINSQLDHARAGGLGPHGYRGDASGVGKNQFNRVPNKNSNMDTLKINSLPDHARGVLSMGVWPPRVGAQRRPPPLTLEKIN
jgi:hypothetical protein